MTSQKPETNQVDPQATKNITLNDIDNFVEVSPQFKGSYNVFSGYSKDTLGFTAKGLLNLAEWVTEHKYQLQIEARANYIQLLPGNHEIDFDRQGEIYEN